MLTQLAIITVGVLLSFIYLALIGGHSLASSTGIIAFTSNVSGNSEIYLLDIQHDLVVNLTRHPADDLGPTWSHHSGLLAFYADRDSDGATEIYLMNVTGSNIRRVNHEPGNYWRPQWSPDGEQFVFIHDFGNILIMDSNGENRRGLTYGFSPAWSPIDSQVAYYVDLPESEDFDIYVLNVENQMLRNLTWDRSDDWSPAWSPDGRQLAFVSSRDGNAEIYVMESDCVSPCPARRLTYNTVMDLAPAWSVNGQYIAYESQTNGKSQLFIMNADGSDSHLLYDDRIEIRAPIWLNIGHSP